jgi:hypothetical protein
MNAKILPKDAHNLHRQRGAATLFVVVIVLLLVTLITYTMTNTTVVEGRMTNSDVKSRQAFHAAQAGLDFALQKILTNDLGELQTACGETVVDEGNPASPTFQLLFGEGIPECPSPLVGLQTRSAIRSIGRSADGSAVRVLEVAIDLEREWIGTPVAADPSAIPPPTIPGAVVSRGSITFSGTADVGPCATIAACEALATPGNKQVPISGLDQILVTSGTSISGGTTGTPSTRLESQHKNIDSSLQSLTGDQFFEQILGADKATFQAAAVEITSSSSITEVNVNPFIWAQGDITLNGGQYGTPDKPVTLVVNGDLTLAGNVIFWGVVYVIGDVDKSVGTNKIFGALVGENDIDLASGNAAVYFNEDLSAGPALAGWTGETATELGGVQASFDSRSWREIFF